MEIPFVTFENMHKEIKQEVLEKFKKIYIMVYSADTGTCFYNAVYTSKRNSSI